MKNLIWKLKQWLMKFFDEDIVWHCSSCGWLPSFYNEYMDNDPSYCPRCGCKIVD